jgi:hypothetical protein
MKVMILHALKGVEKQKGLYPVRQRLSDLGVGCTCIDSRFRVMFNEILPDTFKSLERL